MFDEEQSSKLYHIVRKETEITLKRNDRLKRQQNLNPIFEKSGLKNLTTSLEKETLGLTKNQESNEVINIV